VLKLLKKYLKKIANLFRRNKQMSGIICHNCGHDNQLDATYCDECGAELPKSELVDTYYSNQEEQQTTNQENLPIESEINSQMSETMEPETAPENELNQPETTTSEVPVSPPTVLDVDEEQEKQSIGTILELPKATLVSQETDERLELPAEKTTIYLGRPNEEINIDIDLSQFPNAEIISRVHASIILEGDTYYLEDAGSQNGTALNGEEIKPGARYRKKLSHGDTITFGRKRKMNFTFEVIE
jgi:pSer/pThr/pTyr-binding forkhead associated (FHA) protein